MPILTLLSDGGVTHYDELRKAVRDTFYKDLPDDLLSQKTKTGEQLILNRIGWGLAYLKQAKMIDRPSRAMVQITEKGLTAAKAGNLSLSDIKSDPDFLAHRNRKTTSSQAQIVSEDASPQDLIDSGVQAIEDEVKNDILTRLKKIDPYYFERVVLDLLHKMGYGEFIETSKSGDGGIDGIINQDELGLEKIYVQAKRYNDHKVHETDIRNFIGAMNADTYKGVFVTTSSFDQPAIEKAAVARHKIILIDGIQLANLMYRYDIGVQVRATYLVKGLDEDYFV